MGNKEVSIVESHARFIEWVNGQVQAGCTKTEVAESLGLTYMYFSRILSGKKPLTDAMVGRFCMAYGFKLAAQVLGTRRAEWAEMTR